MKNSNYFVVFGFMINELKLKGAERDIYAIIHGYSKDGQGRFTGSLNYLCETTLLTKPGVIKALKGLIAKELIFKEDKVVNSVKYCSYRVVNSDFEGGKLSSQVVNSVHDSSQLSLPNSNLNNKEIVKEKENASLILFEDVFKFYKTLTTVGSHKGQAGERFKKLSDVKQQKLFEYLKEYSGRAAKIEAAKGWLRPLPAFERFIRHGYWENVDLPEVKQEAKQTQKSNIKIFLG